MKKMQKRILGALPIILALFPFLTALGSEPAGLRDREKAVSLTITKLASEDRSADQDNVITGQGGFDSSNYMPIPNVSYIVTHWDYENQKAATPIWNYVKSTGADGSVMFSSADRANMPQGTYKIEEVYPSSVIPDNTYDAQTFYVDLPMTDPITSTEWIYDIYVYPKNTMADEQIQVQKQVEQNRYTYSNGDTVIWGITAAIPYGIQDAKYYLMADHISTSMRYQEIRKVFCRIGNTDYPLNAETDYKLYYLNDLSELNAALPALDMGVSSTIPSNWRSWNSQSGQNGGYAVAALTEPGMKKAAGLQEQYDPEKVQMKFCFEISTTLRLTGEEELGYLYNHADIYYKNRNDFAYEASTRQNEGGGQSGAYIITSGIKVFKYSSKNTDKTPLGKAEFILRRYDENAGRYEYYRHEEAQGTSWIAEHDLPVLGTGGMDYSAVTVKVSDSSDGYLAFLGLEDGVYELVEITAPPGYNLLGTPVRVTVSSRNEEADGTFLYQTEVKNRSGWTLPSTGGSGTLLFTFGGLFLIAAAVILLCIFKKDRIDESK